MFLFVIIIVALSKCAPSPAVEYPGPNAKLITQVTHEGLSTPIFVTPITVEGGHYLLVQLRVRDQWQVTLCPRAPAAIEEKAEKPEKEPAAAPAPGGF